MATSSVNTSVNGTSSGSTGMPFTQAERILKLTTPLGEDALILTAVHGREAISGLFHFTLESVWQNTRPMDFKRLLGQTVTIELMANEPVGSRYINGIVSSIAQGAWDREKDITLYTLEVVPQLWLLTRNTQIRIFQQKTTIEIIQNVISDLGLPSPRTTTQRTYSPREYTVQYYESDFAFISRLMEQDGIYYYFQHDRGQHTLILADQKGSFEDLPGGADVEFEEVMSGPREDLRIFEWTKEQSIRSGDYTLRDWNFEKPTLKLESAAKSLIPQVVKQRLEIYEYAGKYQEADEGDGVVKVRMQEEDTPGVVVNGKSWHWQFLPGYKFNLKQHFADKGKFVLTGVRTACQQPLGTETEDATYENRFTAIPEDVQYRPPRITPVPRVKGVQTAIVVGPSGEEIYTDKYGRIKVQFHWDREGQYNENSSCWMRVASYWAGKQWGAIHTPRIGQEVIVDFIDGNVDRPLVTGSVYNAEQMPPWSLPANKTYSGIRSRSSKDAGSDMLNEIRFDDKKDSELLFIQAQKDMNVRVKNDRLELTDRDQHLTITRDRMEKVSRDNHGDFARDFITKVGRDHHLEIDGKEAIKITGSQSLAVSGDVIEQFQGNHSSQITQNLYLKAMQVVIEASTGLTLKVGGNFVTIDPSGVAIQGTLVQINSGGSALSGTAGSLVSPLSPTAAQPPITTGPTAASALPTGGAVPASGAVVAATSAPAGKWSAASNAPTHNPTSEEKKLHWIEIELVDEAARPVTGEPYSITLPDGSTVADGTLDEKGRARVENIDAGNCKVTFPALDKEAWAPK
ncbi:MAG TPA: type VI secretion system tip protein TssI/VgrG [Bryobacteraceae bacterium]|nr:type VI secretion system tip protein TssI/VgrG [Bryobacteraceae bacterium]